MRVHLKRGNKFIGVDPSTPGVVYADRDTGSEWERVELTKRSDGHFDARFIAANRQLAMTPDGRLETRDAGAVGPWESFYATEQPDGAKFLYQTNGDTVGPVLLMLEA